jgi:hypothetical protein
MAQFTRSRRGFLRVAGAATVVGVAGCTTGNGGGDGDAGGAEELPEGVSAEEFESGPVPEQYRTASSQGDETRDPEALVSKEDAQFMEADEAVDEGLAQEGNNCGNCADFIPDKNGDGFGACAEVEGYVDGGDWCALWEAYEA